MAKITSREELIEYCLRRLGHPVIEINVSEEQIEDRIDDAFLMYIQYHYDATETVYWKHEITQEDLDRKDENGQRYLLVNDNIISIVRVFPLTTLTTGSYLFDAKYHLFLTTLWDFSSIQLQYYTTVRQHLRNIELLFNNEVPIRYQRHKNKLYLDANWDTSFLYAGSTIMIEAYSVIEPEEYRDVYNDMWLKAYCTALIRRQWGENLKKFNGIQLPSGVTLNGQQIYAEALQDIEKLEFELQTKYTLPSQFFMG